MMAAMEQQVAAIDERFEVAHSNVGLDRVLGDQKSGDNSRR